MALRGEEWQRQAQAQVHHRSADAPVGDGEGGLRCGDDGQRQRCGVDDGAALVQQVLLALVRAGGKASQGAERLAEGADVDVHLRDGGGGCGGGNGGGNSGGNGAVAGGEEKQDWRSDGGIMQKRMNS